MSYNVDIVEENGSIWTGTCPTLEECLILIQKSSAVEFIITNTNGAKLAYFNRKSSTDSKNILVRSNSVSSGWWPVSTEKVGDNFVEHILKILSETYPVYVPPRCEHIFKEYIGLTHKFNYCTKCDEKEQR